MLSFFANTLLASWGLLQQASIYILFGLLVGGLLKVFLSPAYVANHLGTGRFSSVFKAALLGIPIPLCSCGVLPAAASLKKQGANNGATTAFLISTPESGVDSISISWALLDPIMTVARPISAFLSAFAAGIAENFLNPAAFIAKGVSPGTALVFLLVGPATNITSLSVLVGLLGKRATLLYLSSIAVVSVLCGLVVDAVYLSLGISAVVVIGKAADVLPPWLMLATTLLLLTLSIKPLYRIVKGWMGGNTDCGCSSDSCTSDHHHGHNHGSQDISTADCNCAGACGSNNPVQLQPLSKIDLNDKP